MRGRGAIAWNWLLQPEEVGVEVKSTCEEFTEKHNTGAARKAALSGMERNI